MSLLKSEPFWLMKRLINAQLRLLLAVLGSKENNLQLTFTGKKTGVNGNLMFAQT